MPEQESEPRSGSILTALSGWLGRILPEAATASTTATTTASAAPSFAPPKQIRLLAEVLAELGHTWMWTARQIKNTSSSRRRRALSRAADAYRDALREQPSAGEIWLYLADTHEQLGKYDEVLRDHLEAARASPELAGRALAGAYVWLTTDRMREIRGWLGSDWIPAMEGLNLTGQAGAALYTFLGQSALAINDTQQALREFEQAVSSQPDEPGAHEWLAHARRLSGDTTGAIDGFREAIRLAELKGAAARGASARLRLIGLLAEDGRFQDAVQLATEGVERHLAPAEQFCLAQSRCWIQMDMPREAFAAAVRACELDSSLVEAHSLRARALFELGMFSAAVEAADAALRLDPQQLRTLLVKVKALARGGEKDVDMAIRLLQVYVPQNPTDVSSALLLLRLADQRGITIPDSVEYLEKVVKASSPNDPSRPALLLNFAEALLQTTGRAKDAQDSVRELSGAAAEANPRWHRVLGDAHRQLGQREAALQSYRAGLTLDPEDPKLLQGLSDCLAESGDYKSAIEVQQRLLALDPRVPPQKARLSKFYASAGEYEPALSLLDEALLDTYTDSERIELLKDRAELLEDLRREPADIAKAFAELGRLYKDLERFDSAVESLQKAWQLWPDDATVGWDLAFALRMLGADMQAPELRRELLDRSRQVWQDASVVAHPVPDYAWAYLTRAVINELSVAPGTKARALIWEALGWVEHALVHDRRVVTWTMQSRYCRTLSLEACSLEASSAAIGVAQDDRDAIFERITNLAIVGEFESALKLLNDHRDTLSALQMEGVEAFIEIHLGNYVRAVELATQALKQAENDSLTLLIRAASYQLCGMKTEMEQDYRAVWDLRTLALPPDPSDLAWAAYNLAKLGPTPDLDLVQQAINLLMQHGEESTEQRANYQRNLGLYHLVRGNVAEAEALLASGIQATTNTRELDDFVNLDLDDLKHSISGWPSVADIEGVISRVRVLVTKRRPEVDWPRTDPVMVSRAAEAERMQILDEAARANAETEPPAIAAAAGLARQYAAEERWDEAERIYTRLEATGRFWEARSGIVEALRSASERLRAEGDIVGFSAGQERLVHILPEQRATFLFDLASIHEKNGDVEQALEALRQAISLADTETRKQLHARAGDLLIRAGNIEAAAREYASGLERAVPSGDRIAADGFRIRLAWLAVLKEDTPAALREFETVLEGMPEPLSSFGDRLISNSGAFLRSADARRAFAACLRVLTYATASHQAPLKLQVLSARLRFASLPTPDSGETSGSAALADDQNSVVPPLALAADSNLFPQASETPEVKRWIEVEAPLMRARIQAEVGVSVPGVRFRSEPDLTGGNYVLYIHEAEHGRGSVALDERYFSDPALCAALDISTIPAGRESELADLVRLAEPEWRKANRVGLPLMDAYQFTLFHLERIVRRHIPELVGIQVAQQWLIGWRDQVRPGWVRRSALVDDVLRPPDRLVQLVSVVRALLSEGLAIHDLDQLIPAFVDVSHQTTDIVTILEHSRAALLTAVGPNREGLQVVGPVLRLEEMLAPFVQTHGTRREFIVPRSLARQLMSEIRQQVPQQTCATVVWLVQDASLRPFVHALMRRLLPDTLVTVDIEPSHALANEGDASGVATAA